MECCVLIAVGSLMGVAWRGWRMEADSMLPNRQLGSVFSPRRATMKPRGNVSLRHQQARLRVRAKLCGSSGTCFARDRSR